jgi:hypothetical protein
MFRPMFAMKTLIAITTCTNNEERRVAVSATWMQLVPDSVDAAFLTGRDYGVSQFGDGLTHLDCPDTYRELPQKTLAIVRYAVDHDYELLIKVDDDTFLMPRPDYIAEFAKHDYFGCVGQRGYCQGGCYSLSHKAMHAVLKHADLFTTGLEDATVGRALHAEGISPTHTDRIKVSHARGFPRLNNDIISAHYCSPATLRNIFRNCDSKKTHFKYFEV